MPEFPFWLGGVAASLAATCTHPLDVTKVRMQTLAQENGAKRPSTIHVISSSVKQSGIGSLYTGLSAALMRQMSYSLVRLGAYERLKASLSKDGKITSVRSLFAASVAGALGGIAGNPADIIMIRMTSDITRQPAERYNYSNAVTGLISIIRHEGVKGLTRGIETNVTRAILMNASQVGSYDFFKSQLLSRHIPLTNYQLRDNLILHLISSTLAGTFATTVCSPVDVVRSRVMASSETYATPLRIVSESLRQEGVRFLFKGWTPAFVRLAPNTILLFVFYEQLKLGWKKAFST